MLAMYVVLLLGISVVIAVTCLSWLSSSSSDRLAVIANLLSAGTLLLALVAGIVALAAYSAATGLPDLKISVTVPLTGLKDAIPNVIRLQPLEHLHDRRVASEINIAYIVISNASSYAARSPALIMRIRGGNIRQEIFSASEEWQIIETDLNGNITAVQWDGGANYMIHGKTYRQVPKLSLEGLNATSTEAAAYISFQLVADGYSREGVKLPFTFGGTIRQSEVGEWL